MATRELLSPAQRVQMLRIPNDICLVHLFLFVEKLFGTDALFSKYSVFPLRSGNHIRPDGWSEDELGIACTEVE